MVKIKKTQCFHDYSIELTRTVLLDFFMSADFLFPVLLRTIFSLF